MEMGLRVAAQLNRMESAVERRDSSLPFSLDTNDSAFYAMTDFRRENAITVLGSSAVEDALLIMNRSGVHALIVTDRAADEIDAHVTGLITSFDIDRKRSHSRSRIGVDPRERVSVGDVMTAWNELSLVHFESLQTLAAKEIYEMFQGTGLTHLLVVETQTDDSAVARGILSRATLARRLGCRTKSQN